MAIKLSSRYQPIPLNALVPPNDPTKDFSRYKKISINELAPDCAPARLRYQQVSIRHIALDPLPPRYAPVALADLVLAGAREVPPVTHVYDPIPVPHVYDENVLQDEAVNLNRANPAPSLPESQVLFDKYSAFLPTVQEAYGHARASKLAGDDNTDCFSNGHLLMQQAGLNTDRIVPQPESVNRFAHQTFELGLV